MAFMVTCFAWQVDAQTYNGDNVGAAISNTNPTTLSTANVPLTGVIGTNPGDFVLDNVVINLSHTFDGDLDISLIAPSGATINLSDDNGVGGDDYIDTVFMDGNPNITTGSAPFTGTFEAEEGLLNTIFMGEDVTGDWVLSMTDDAGGDDGTFNSYAITFSEVPMVIGDPPVIACPSDIMADTDPGECGAIVNFADAIATDTEDGIIGTTQTMGPLTGEQFPTGDTIVEFTAEDSDGNVVTCQFTVTVTDMELPEALCQNLTLELMGGSSVSIAPSDIKIPLRVQMLVKTP